MTQQYRAYLDLIAAMTIVGSSVVVGKVLITNFPIFMTLMLRFAIALPVLIWFTHRADALYFPSLQSLRYVFLQALTGVFLFNVLMLAGLQFTSAIKTGIISSTTPALIAIIGWLLLREQVTRYEWAGIGLSVLGVLIVNSVGINTGIGFDLQGLFGNLLVLGAFACEALFTIFRKSSKDIPPILSATLVTGFGLLLCLPIGTVQLLQYDITTITMSQIAIIAYYGLVVSALAYLLWFRGLEHASIGAAGIFSAVLPISTLIFSVLILQEQFRWVHLLGLICVLSAMLLTSMTSPSQVEPST